MSPILTLAARNVKSQRNPIVSRTPITPTPELSLLAARLQAGAYERCPSCLKWINRQKAAGMGLFVPNDGGASIPYVICNRCTQRIGESELSERIENYLVGVQDD